MKLQDFISMVENGSIDYSAITLTETCLLVIIYLFCFTCSIIVFLGILEVVLMITKRIKDKKNKKEVIHDEHK